MAQEVLVQVKDSTGTVQDVSPTNPSPQESFTEGIARGEVSGSSCFRGYGEIAAANGNNLDIWTGPTTTQPEPIPAGFALWVASSSAADNGTTATGILTAMAHYLDTSGVQQTVVVTLNGTTPVNTGVADCMFVNTTHAITVGSGLVAAGDIDFTQGSGGTVVSRISATENHSLSTMRMIPAGKNLFIHGWTAYASAGAGGKVANIRLRSTNNELAVLTGVYLFKDTAILKDSNAGWLPFDPVLLVPPLATVKVGAWTTGIMNCASRWSGYLRNV